MMNMTDNIYTITILTDVKNSIAKTIQKNLPKTHVLQAKTIEQIHPKTNLLIVLKELKNNDLQKGQLRATIWSSIHFAPSLIIDEIIPRDSDADFLTDRITHHLTNRTKRENTDKALMQLANALNNAVMVCDHTGELIWTNKAFEKIYGYNRREFIAQNGSNIKDFGNQDLIGTNLEAMRQNRTSIEYITSIRTQKKEATWLQTTLSPVYENGLLKWIVAIESDISKIKDNENTLEIQSESLQRLTEELKEINHEMQAQRDQLNKKHEELMIEKERSDELLHNILPEIIAHQLKKGKKKTKRHKSVTVMFADFKGFTKICKHLDPEEIVSTLDELFSKFDTIIEKHFIEKIKTIGDAYMCAGGMPMKNNSHAVNIVMAALEIQHFLFQYNTPRMLNKETVWECRIGIHSGEVFAGVVGQKKFAYDIWGDTVNVAARMETGGAVNSVNISETTYELIKDYFVCIPRGGIDAKNIGNVNMFFVEGLKPQYALDTMGVFPNEEFEKIVRSL